MDGIAETRLEDTQEGLAEARQQLAAVRSRLDERNKLLERRHRRRPPRCSSSTSVA